MTLPRYPIVQFVSAPEPDATVRFDFQNADPAADAETVVLAEDFSLGAPQLMGEPGEGGRYMEPRSMFLPAQIKGAKALALRVQQRLAREVLRKDNWLHVRLNADSPSVWMKTFQSQPNPLNFDMVQVDGPNDSRDDYWRIPVSLDAEPLAQGELVTHDLGPVATNPFATHDQPGSVLLPAIRGDAPTPLDVLVEGPTSGMQAIRNLLVGSLSASVAAGPLAPARSSWGTGVDGEDDEWRPTAELPDWAEAYTTASVALPCQGTYRVLTRMRRSTAGAGAFEVRAVNAGGAATAPVRVRVGSGGSTWYAFIDLGLISLPASPVMAGVSDMPEQFVQVQVRQVESGGNVGFYAQTVLVPVGCDTISSRLLRVPGVGDSDVAVGSNAPTRVLMAGSERVVRGGIGYSSSARQPADPGLPIGGWAEATPGEANTLLVMAGVVQPGQHTGAVNPPSELNVTVSYRPLYLNLAGDL